MRTTCLSLVLVCAVLGAVRAQDSYLETTRASCLRTSGFVDCAKYKVANFVHRIASAPRSMDLGPLRLVNIPKANSSIEGEDSFISRAATYSAKEPEYLKMMKYGLRQASVFLTSHGVSMPLAGLGGGGPQLVYEDPFGTNTVAEVPVEEQARSRNLHLIVPLMIMVKLMSIKALLIPTLLGVAAIKKFIVLTVMILPSVIHKLKACKVVPHYVHYQPHHTHSHEFHDDYVPHHEHHSHHSDIHRRMGLYRSFRK